MINTLPPIYPDELFYSWFVRYHVISGNISSTTTMKELFNKGNNKLNFYYPFNLDFFTQQLPKEVGISSDSIITNHTVFPFLKVFMSPEDINMALDAMKGDSRFIFWGKTRHNYGNSFGYNDIKLCSECYKEDKVRFGEAYIHRTHQVPGNLVCLKHNNYLTEFKVPYNTPTDKFIDINNCDIKFADNNNLVYGELLDLSNDISQILSGKLKDYNLNVIKQKYSNMLKFKLYKYKHNVNQDKLTDDFLSFYSGRFLQHKDYVTHLSDVNDWVKVITRSSCKNIHAVKHLLFIKFLFKNIQGMQEYDNCSNPFGVGPWPCMNPVSNHYKDDMVTTCIVNKTGEKVIGTFRCECGFTYTRRWDFGANNKYLVTYILDFGEMWENKLRETFSSKKYSIKEIADIMKCDKSTVRKHAKKLKLIHDNAQNVDFAPEDIDLTDSKLIEYKLRLEDIISQGTYKSRNHIRRSITKEYDYVMKKDRGWMDEILPPKLERVPPKHNKDWDKVDQQLIKRVTKAIKEILEDDKIVKVTLLSISQKINYSSLLRSDTLNKLLKTKKYIELNLESREDFKKRRIKKCIKLLSQNGQEINKTNIF